MNNACDSPEDKRQIKNKFELDVVAARTANSAAKAFAFFTNVDLTPSEVTALENFALARDFTSVDIYWRERLRVQLDNVEGLAIRFQYLSISLSEAEQASFFARFGKDLERIILGKFERIEAKLDEIDFARWKAGRIRRVHLEIVFREWIDSLQSNPEHFRVCLELQSVFHERRSIFIGAQDDYWKAADRGWYFGTKNFICRQKIDKLEDSWIPHHERIGGGHVSSIDISLVWRPESTILAYEFDWLSAHFHFTENLLHRISHIRFEIDDYLFIDRPFNSQEAEKIRPTCGWPSALDAEQSSLSWLHVDCGGIDMSNIPRRL